MVLIGLYRRILPRHPREEPPEVYRSVSVDRSLIAFRSFKLSNTLKILFIIVFVHARGLKSLFNFQSCQLAKFNFQTLL